MSQLTLPLAGKTRCGYCGRELESHGTLDGQTVYQCPAFPTCAAKLQAAACPECRSTARQRYQWSPDLKPVKFRHRCFDCGYDSGWVKAK